VGQEGAKSDHVLLDTNACTVPSSQVDSGKGGQGTIMAAAIKAGDAYLLDINACTVPSSQVDPGKGGHYVSDQGWGRRPS